MFPVTARGRLTSYVTFHSNRIRNQFPPYETWAFKPDMHCTHTEDLQFHRLRKGQDPHIHIAIIIKIVKLTFNSVFLGSECEAALIIPARHSDSAILATLIIQLDEIDKNLFPTISSLHLNAMTHFSNSWYIF